MRPIERRLLRRAAPQSRRQESLDLDFLTGRYAVNGFIKNFADIFTFSRASGGGRINALGAFEWVAANQPRIDHNPINLAAGTGPQTISLPKDRVFAVTITGGGTVAITGTGVDLKYMGPSSGTIRTLPGTGNTDITFTPSGTVTAVHVREVRGILIEDQRTNCITNSVLAGAGVGAWPAGWGADAAPSGLTVSVLGTGTEAGLNYVDFRINGTPAAGGQWQVAIGGGSAASSSNPWTLSAFTKLVGGSMTNVSNPRLAMNYVNSGWSYIGESNSNINTGGGSLAAQRAEIYATPIATTANIVPYFKVSFSAGKAIDVTFRLALPQLEQGSFPTSAIQTSGSQVTRAADVCSINTLSPWFKASEGTVFVEYDRNGFNPAGNSGVVSWYDSTKANYQDWSSIGESINGGSAASQLWVGGVSQANQVIAKSPVVGQVRKSAMAFAANNVGFASNGVAAILDTSAALASAPNVFAIGGEIANASAGAFVNGHIRRLRFWTRRRSESQILDITA